VELGHLYSTRSRFCL